jgi:hypothetical protein
MSDLRIEGKDLVDPVKGVVFSCENKIKKMLEEDGFIYLLLFSMEEKSNNVLCVDLSGNVVWKIDAVDWVGKTAFANIYEKNGKLYAGAWSGFECEIDRKTGRILNKIFMK